ncbi:MAG: YibE/F family protein [Actinobacteria bacterium]|nr:YibE/F family protein [Actinomycetota bacterium]MBU4335054.1 YibE/F family protein [Actinomycetota bacterium]
MVRTWPGSVHQVAQNAGLVDTGVQYLSATVTGTKTTTCDATVEDTRADGSQPSTVSCLQVSARVTSGSRAGADISVYATASVTAADVPVGTRIVVELYPASDGQAETWAWSDFRRTVPLGTLALAFVLVAGLVGGWRGLRAVLGLAIAFVVLWVYLLPALITGQPAIAVSLAASVAIMVVVAYLTHGPSLRTTTALIGTVAGLLLIAGIGALATHAAHINPVAGEEDYRLAGMLGDDGVARLRGVFLASIVLAGLGVLNDVTITQASAVGELAQAAPRARFTTLFTGGMRIGRDHLASTVYTIAFAYAGAGLPVLLMLQLYELPLAQTLGQGVFAQEIVRTAAGAIGLLLAIPATTAIAAAVEVRSRHRPAPADPVPDPGTP